MTNTISPADDNGRAYLPAEFLKAYNHVRSLSSDELIEHGYINVSAVIDALRPPEYQVILTRGGDRPLRVIKEVRTYAEIGLLEARDLVEGVRTGANPSAVLLTTTDHENANRLVDALLAAGADAHWKVR